MSATEKLSVNLFDKMFGRDLKTRITALQNEYNELIEAFNNLNNDECPKAFMEFSHELADVQSIITHITSIIKSSHKEQLLYTNKKLLSRIEISKYRGREFKVKADEK